MERVGVGRARPTILAGDEQHATVTIRPPRLADEPGTTIDRPPGPPGRLRRQLASPSSWSTVAMGATVVIAGLIALIVWNFYVGAFLMLVGCLYVAMVVRRGNQWRSAALARGSEPRQPIRSPPMDSQGGRKGLEVAGNAPVCVDCGGLCHPVVARAARGLGGGRRRRLPVRGLSRPVGRRARGRGQRSLRLTAGQASPSHPGHRCRRRNRSAPKPVGPMGGSGQCGRAGDRAGSARATAGRARAGGDTPTDGRPEVQGGDLQRPGQPRRASTAPPSSTCSPAAAPWASRPCRGARRTPRSPTSRSRPGDPRPSRPTWRATCGLGPIESRRVAGRDRRTRAGLRGRSATRAGAGTSRCSTRPTRSTAGTCWSSCIAGSAGRGSRSSSRTVSIDDPPAGWRVVRPAAVRPDYRLDPRGVLGSMRCPQSEPVNRPGQG